MTKDELFHSLFDEDNFMGLELDESKKKLLEMIAGFCYEISQKVKGAELVKPELDRESPNAMVQLKMPKTAAFGEQRVRRLIGSAFNAADFAAVADCKGYSLWSFSVHDIWRIYGQWPNKK